VQLIKINFKEIYIRDISTHINNIYEIDISHLFVSKIIDRALLLHKKLQNIAKYIAIDITL